MQMTDSTSTPPTQAVSTNEQRLVIAYGEPPAAWGFTPSSSGRAWQRKTRTLMGARLLADKLRDLGIIHGVIVVW